MTEENLARHVEDPNTPFWQMLKTGSDAFAEGERPPKIAVCDQRYVFNPSFQSNNLDPNAPCPSRTDSAAAAAL